MTGLRWLALLALAAALALMFLLTDLDADADAPGVPSDRGAAALGESETVAELEPLTPLEDLDAEEVRRLDLGDAADSAKALDGAQPDSGAPEAADIPVLRVELVGPGAGHPEAALSEDFQIFGSASPYESKAQTAPLLSDDGSYLFAGTEPVEVRWVRLSARLFVDALVPVPAIRKGETQTVELPVARGMAASGVILDMEGLPIEGATVRLGSWERRDLSASIGFEEEVLTDAEGRFLVGGVRPGEATLRVSCDGFEAASEPLGLQREGDAVDGLEVKLEGGGTVVGTVRWPDGSPAPKSIVRLARSGADWENASRTKTDAEGNFEFRGLRGTDFRIAASAKKKRSRTRWRAEGQASIGRRVQLELNEGITLSGSARDDAGTPLTHFRVAATPVGIDKGADPGRVRVNGGDGTFELRGLEPGSYDVVVTAKEHTPGRPVRVNLPAAGARVDAVLNRLANAAGIAVDTESRPLAGINLRVGGRKVTTDEEGRFEVAGIDAGALLVTLLPGSTGVIRSALAVIDPGETRDDIVVVIGRGATVRCRLHPSLAGGIYSRATLRLENTFNMSSQDFAAEGLDEGVAVFSGLPAGRYWVALPSVQGREWAESHRDTHPIPVEVARDATATVTVGAPDAYPLRISGQVTRGGELQSALIVYVYGTERERNFPAAIGRTDSEGRYELHLRTPGEYAFNIGVGQMAQARFTVQVAERPSQEHDFALPDAILKGRATYADGVPVVGRMYVLVRADAPLDTKQAGDLQFSRTRTDGRFQFTGLHPGRYRLHTGNYFKEHDTDGLVVLENIEVESGTDTPEIRVVVPRAAVLTVQAVDENARPLAAHAVTLETPSGVRHLFYAQGKTDAQGYQRVRGIGPGPWRVIVRDSTGRTVGAQTVEISEGESRDIAVTCSP